MLSLLIVVPALAAAPTISLAGDFGEPRVIVPAPADARFAHLSWPKVVRAKDGTLVVAYIAGRFHGNHGEGCPAVSLSTDGGKTFSPPKVLKEYGPNDAQTAAGNIALGLADDSAIVMLSMAFKANESHTIDGWRSTDNGKTWQAIDVSKLAGRTGSVYGHVFNIPGQGLTVVGHFRKGSPTQELGLWMSHSSDHGKTWCEPRAIAGGRLVEPAFVHAAGRTIGLIRPGNTPPHYMVVASDDAGKTWTKPTSTLKVPEPRFTQLPSPGLFVDPNNPKRLLALVNQRFPRSKENALYGQIDLYSADVKTLDWKKLGTVAKFPATLRERGDLTYGWMTPTGGKKWFLVFYCGLHRGANDIYGLEFEVPDDK